MRNISIISQRLDKIIFITFLILIILGSYRLAVYHYVYVADIKLLRINPDNTVVNEEIGNIPKLFGYGDYKENIFWRSLENSINNNVELIYSSRNYEPGTELVFIINYSYNSTKEDKTKEYRYKVATNGKLQKFDNWKI